MLPGLASAIVGARGPGLIQFVGGAIATKTDASSTLALNSGLTGGIASSVSNGDLVIAAYTAGDANDVTLAITDGTNPYTLIATELNQNDVYDANLRVAYKFVSGDTATTFGTDNYGGVTAVYVFRGVDATVHDATPTTATGGNEVYPNPPSITPVTTGAFIVCIGAASHNRGAQTFTSSDLSDFLTAGRNDNLDSSLGIGQKDDWTTGAFDAAAFGFTSTSNTDMSWAAMSIALRPA
jgi:hypothetical protein